MKGAGLSFNRLLLALCLLAGLFAADLGSWGMVSAAEKGEKSAAKRAANVLVYEVESRDKTVQVPDATMKQVVRAIDRRVNPGSLRRATVRQAGGNRIEVVVPSADAAAVQKIQRTLEAVGTLEFHILATTVRPQYRSFIERAKKLPDGESQLKDEEGRHLARWVPVTTGQEKPFRDIPDIATRTVERGGTKQFEVLVVIDPYDVNGSYLMSARVGEWMERSCVNLTFNGAGAHLFGRLTGSHLPDKTRNSRYHLGIILDGHLYSAPYIKSAIFANAQIAGDFTIEQAFDIRDALNDAALPVKVRRVQPPAEPDNVKAAKVASPQ